MEGWHTGFNKNKAPHPNIYKFIESILEVQQKNDIHINALDNGEKATLPLSKYVKINQSLFNYTDQQINGEITVDFFLNQVEKLLKS